MGARIHLALAFIGSIVVTLGVSPAFAAIAGEDEQDSGPPVRLLIGLDLSTSNPLITSKSYAASVGALVAEDIRHLPMASHVMVRTFGSYSNERNGLRIDRDISSQRDEKPRAVASLVEQVIAGVPQLVKDGKLQAQGSTNIIGFLEDMSDQIDCSEADTFVLLVSDGIEDSEYARLSKRDATLPPPRSQIFDECSELEIVGLGQGANSPSFTRRLHDQWEAWAMAAGFRRFEGLSDW